LPLDETSAGSRGANNSTAANSQTAVLDQNWRNGSSWDLNFQYLW